MSLFDIQSTDAKEDELCATHISITVIKSNRKTKIKYRPVGILKNLIEKTKIKYRPVGMLKNIIKKNKNKIPPCWDA